MSFKHISAATVVNQKRYNEKEPWTFPVITENASRVNSLSTDVQ
jgi:hypothetical protein